jgi:sulfatase maturation enzyme AslB (radical SAM superfamily)
MSQVKAMLERHREYPHEVTIETTGRCNARCIFCPHSELERKNKYMSDQMFLRIIGQLKEIPQSHRFFISPFKVNELLMDKQIFERIDIINQSLTNAYIRIFSNFHTVTGEDIERICQIKNLSDIDISLNSLDKEEYHMLMGIDLDITLQNIHRLLEYIRKNGITMSAEKMIFSRVSQTPDTDREYIQAFADEFKDYPDLVKPQVILRQEWIDYIPSETPLNQNQPCARWADINICCDGVVAFCCMDGRGAFPLGNIMENTVLEIYNKPGYRQLRVECPNKAEVTPCRHCSQ